MSEITHRIRFVASAADAREEIQKYENQIVAVSRTADAMANTLGGGRLLQAAHNWTAAVERAGGVTKLTAGEKEHLNQVLGSAIEKYDALGQAAPAAIQRLYQQTLPMSTATESWTSAVTRNAAAYVAGLATFETARQGIAALSRFVTDSVEAYAAAETATTRVATALAAQGAPVELNVRAFQALARQLELTTKYEDDALLSAMGFATQLGILPTEMQPVMQGALDLASGLGIDLESALRMIVRANDESVAAFSRVGISLDQAKVKAEGLPYILAAIRQHVGGQAAAEVETLAGRTDQLGNAWGNFKEAVGQVLVDGAKLPTVLQGITTYVHGMTGSLENGTTAAKALMTALTVGGPLAATEMILRIGQASEAAAAQASNAAADGAAKQKRWLDEVGRHASSYLANREKEATQEADHEAKAAEASADRTVKAQQVVERKFIDSLNLRKQLDLEYDAERTRQGGTAAEARIRQIEAERQAAIAAAREIGDTSTETYDRIERNAREKLDGIATDWNILRRTSRDTLMEQYEVARNTYLEMAGSAGEYSRATIEHMRAVMDAAREAAYGMGDAFEAGSARAQSSVSSASKAMGSDLDSVAEKARKTAEELHNMGSSVTYDLTTNYGRKLIEEMNPGITEFLQQGYSIAQAMRLLQGRRYNFQVDVGSPDGNDWYPKRAAGGPVDAGMPYWVGELGPELFVPRSSGAIVPNGAAAAGISLAPGAVVINYPILNSPQAMNQLAAIIGEAIVKRARGGGLRVPVGV